MGWRQIASGFMPFERDLVLEAVGCLASRVQRVTLLAVSEGVLGRRESVKSEEDLNSKQEREVWREGTV